MWELCFWVTPDWMVTDLLDSLWELWMWNKREANMSEEKQKRRVRNRHREAESPVFPPLFNKYSPNPHTGLQASVLVQL